MRNGEMYSATSKRNWYFYLIHICNIYQYYLCTHFKRITAKIVKYYYYNNYAMQKTALYWAMTIHTAHTQAKMKICTRTL